MIRLKLNLPEGTVNYNASGALLGQPVDHAPNQIRNYSMPFEITGYITKHDFLAYSLASSDRKFTISEQISLLTSLGFKTVPYFEQEEGRGNELITVKNQYSAYDAVWISLPSGKEFPIPELTHVNTVDWEMSDNKSLTMKVTTDKGIFRVYDMRNVAYYQPGCTAKVWNGELQPFNSALITSPIPSVCPKCSNPLKRVQIYSDLPVFYKCTNSFCSKLVLEEDQTADLPVEEEPAEQDDFRDVITSENESEPIVEDIVPSEDIIDTASTAETADTTTTEDEPAVKQCVKVFVDTAKVGDEEIKPLVENGSIQVVEDIKDADAILVKNKMAVSKNARTLSKENNIELKPIADFE